MNKSLVMCGVAALALASCTQNEVLEVNDSRAIGFDAFTGKGTRTVNDIIGNGSAQSTFNKFYVYGSYEANEENTNVFTGDEVSYSGDSWGYSPAQYWQNGNYKFAAYSNGNEKMTTGVSYDHADGLKLENYVVGEKDLIFAIATANVTDKTNYDTPVNLTFSHLLSKVRFTFTNTFADNQKVIVSNLKIDNSVTKGTYSNTSGSYDWTLSVVPADKKAIKYKEVDVNTSDYEGEDYRAEECYVLPQNASGLTASFTVTVKDALGAIIMTKNFTGISLSVAPVITSWENGKAYNYTAELTPETIDPDGGQGKEIKFTANASDWVDNGTDGGITIGQ